jgi:hypothetical protein
VIVPRFHPGYGPAVVYSGSYALVLALHLVTVAFVVGPAAVAASLSGRHARAGRLDALRDAHRTTRLYTVATLVTVLLGTAMVGLGGVGDQWSYDQAWISASYALWLLGVVLLLAVVVPAQAKAVEALEGGGSSAPLAGRIAAGAGIASLAWTAVIVLMVYKPGA